MKKINSRIISIVLMLMLLVSSSGLTAVASEPTAEIFTAEECAEEVMKMYEEKEEEVFAEEFANEFLDNNYEANVSYNKILNRIYEHEDVLSKNFSDAYVNDDGNLVVKLIGDFEACKYIINEELECENIIFEKGSYPYLEIKETLDELNTKIGDLQEKLNDGRLHDAGALDLMSKYPRAIYDDVNESITVVFGVSEEDALSTEMMKKGNKYELNNVTLNNPALSDYSNYISEFKEYIGDSEMVTYKVEAGYEPASVQAEQWRPGRGIYVVSSSNNMSASSTGYRAKYTYNGKTYYGFVTCEHGKTVGQNVYLTNSSASANKIGFIVNKKISNEVDVAFMNITNSNYTNSNYVYYTSSDGQTRPGTLLDGKWTEVAKNSAIYKAGKKTYLTNAYVFETQYVGYFTNSDGTRTFHTELIQAGKMTESGDSGGVAYVPYGGSSGTSVGIVLGSDSTYSYFVKAMNISSKFGAVPY